MYLAIITVNNRVKHYVLNADSGRNALQAVVDISGGLLCKEDLGDSIKLFSYPTLNISKTPQQMFPCS